MALTINLQEAFQLHQSGRIDEAEACYRAVLERNPDDPHALHFLGLAALQRDNLESAVELIENSLRILPDEPIFLCNLGQARKRLGHFQDAETAYKKALTLVPRLFEAWHNLGVLYESLHDDERAAHCYLSARKLAPNRAYSGDGSLIATLKRHARQLLDQGRAADAAELYRQATEIAPSDPEIWAGLASSQTLSGKPLQAMPAFDRALKLQPGAANLYNNRANAFRDAGQLDAALADYRQALSIDPGYRDACSNMLFANLSVTEHDASSLADLHRQLGPCFDPPQPLRHTHSTGYSIPKRIAIVSADMRQHPVAWFMLSWFEHRDRSAFHLTVYSTSTRQDEVAARIRNSCDAWLDCAELSDADLAERIQADKIDLLLDLSGHTADNRLGVFALRPAPRQATFLGYACTTGLTCFDARIADWVTEPREAEGFSSEPLIRLDGSYFCYTAPDLDLPLTPPPVLKNHYITFGCSTQLAKATDATLSLWGQVLRAVPRSRLLLRSMTLDDPLVRKRLMARMAKAGLDTNRVRLDGPRPLPDHLASWNAIDITLDTTPFNLATQSCESLWMGVPFVTITGNRHAGRLGTSILSGAGMSELVAQDESDFVRRCADLAHDTQRLADFRQNLRTQLQAPGNLLDGRSFARRLDQALAEIGKQ